MSVGYSVFMFILLFGIVPFVLGTLWKNVLKDGGVVFTYLSGFFTILALFELLGPAMMIAKIPVHIQVIVISIAMIIAVVATCLLNRKMIMNAMGKRRLFEEYPGMEKLFFIIFVILLLIQVYFAVFYDIGGWRSDDYMYIVLSDSAIHDDYFFATEVITGFPMEGIFPKYAVCGIYVFYTYISVVTGVPVAAVEHTICCAWFLIMAYGSFYMISKFLFPKEKDNRFIFLILLSVLYLFGMYSHYSLSYRLFGVIWQGKSFLAVVVTPFLLGIYPKILRETVRVKRLAFLVMISLMAVSLTLSSVITLVIIPGCLSLFYLIQSKYKNSVIYFLAMEVVPVIDVVVYALIK